MHQFLVSQQLINVTPPRTLQLLGGVLGVGMLYVIANHEFGSKYPNANAQVGQLSKYSQSNSTLGKYHPLLTQHAVLRDFISLLL